MWIKNLEINLYSLNRILDEILFKYEDILSKDYIESKISIIKNCSKIVICTYTSVNNIESRYLYKINPKSKFNITINNLLKDKSNDIINDINYIFNFTELILENLILN